MGQGNFSGYGDRSPTCQRYITRRMMRTPERPLPDQAPVVFTLIPHAVYPGCFQRFIRREIIITRNDFLRTNIYYRSYEASKWAVNYIRYRKRRANEMRALLAEFGPAGSSPALTSHTTLTVQTLR